MQGLLTAIAALFNNNATLHVAFPSYDNTDGSPATTSNFWWSQAPENAPFPYCIGSVVSGAPEALYGIALSTYGPETIQIRFTVYTSPLNTAMTLAESVVSIFNSNAGRLTLPAGQALTDIFQNGSIIPAYDGKSKNDANVFRADILYTFCTSAP